LYSIKKKKIITKQLYLSVLATFFVICCSPLLHGAEKAKIETVIVEVSPADFEYQLREMGFADVQEIDPSIRVELKYASAENFMGTNVYGNLSKAYLRREAAEKLARANAHLKELRPGLTLLVVDGVRPRHVQRKMRKLLEGTPKQNYVADHRSGSMHNYGCAVDLTIIDTNGNRLDMGTPMDHFGPLSQPRLEAKFLKQGKLTKEQIANRRLLRDVMTKAGFLTIPIEWWHFEAFDKSTIRTKFKIIE
jgi:zinc D-Ala-D-Ala dipeptidase